MILKYLKANITHPSLVVNDHWVVNMNNLRSMGNVKERKEEKKKARKAP